MICCFGELLLRMSPVLNGEWIRQQSMPFYIGGAELNVATALATWKVPSKYCTALPDNYLSKEILVDIAHKGIDTSSIHLSGDRIGLYYLPQGADLKNTGVIYDRSQSSFAALVPGMINWEEVLKECSWFHFSAISPALNSNAAAVCKEALEAATAKGLTISIDLNYRSKLWKYGKLPVDVMPQLVSHCHVIMGNIWSATELLGIPMDASIKEKPNKQSYLEQAGKTAESIMNIYGNCTTVANTFRFDEAEGIKYYAALNTKQGQFISPELLTSAVVDKVGSGDCFMGGLIFGLYHQHPSQEIIDFASAAAFGKLQERGDATRQTIQSVKNILAKNGQERSHS